MRFLHTADLHLGRSFPYEREEDRVIGRKDRFRTFERILKLGIQEQVDYLFLVGDIFEQDKVTAAEVDYVLACLDHAPFTTLLLLGNHDYKLYDEVAARLPENVVLFSNETMDRYEDSSRGVVFYGTSWTRASYNKILQFDGRPATKAFTASSSTTATGAAATDIFPWTRISSTPLTTWPWVMCTSRPCTRTSCRCAARRSLWTARTEAIWAWF